MKILRSKTSTEDVEAGTEICMRSIEIQGQIGSTTFSFFLEHDGSIDERRAIKDVQALMTKIAMSLTMLQKLALKFLDQEPGLKQACGIALSTQWRAGFRRQTLKAQMGGISDGRVKQLIDMMQTLGVIEEGPLGLYKPASLPEYAPSLFFGETPPTARVDNQSGKP